MSSNPRIVVGLRPARPLTSAVLAVALVSSSLACARHEDTSPAPPAGRDTTAVELPPGKLVDSAPNFGWTPGEFSVSHDGTAQYTVPLWVPAGRGSVTPQLSLSYSSRAGNGLLGVGWSLGGLSTISWCGRTIAQDGYTDGGHFDGTDALCLNGNRLVPISPEWSPLREYRTEQETFTRIIAYETQDNVPDFFKVFTKDGKILTFGGSAEARMQPYLLMGTPPPKPAALVRVPGAPRATTAWALDRIEDRNGNAATVEYTRTEGDAAGLWWMELRPARIRYAPNRSVEFIYDDFGRPDKIDGFSGGTHTRTASLMRRIEMWGGPEGGAAELLRQYRIEYDSDSSITRRSLLSRVTECDGKGICKLSLPFEYSQGSYDFEEIDVAASEPTPVSVVDINGDGKSDLIGAAHGGPDLRVARWSPVTGDGFADPRDSGLASWDIAQILDVDADGRTDALAEVPDSGGYRYQLFQPTGAALMFEEVPGELGEWRPAAGQPVYLADLNGSGLPDFVEPAFEGDKRWWYRLNSGASGADRFEPKVDTKLPGNFRLANFAVDTDGDGRTELIASTGGPGWTSWGLHAYADAVQVRPLNLEVKPTAVHFGDVNGDGLVDSVQPYGLTADDGLRVQLNSGNGFGSRTAPSPDEYYKLVFHGYLRDNGVRVVDFNGDGRDDVLVFHSGKPVDGYYGAGLQVYLWTDNAFVRAPLKLKIGDPNLGQWDNTQVLDFDGNGALDLVNVGTDGRLRAFQRLGGVPDLLIGIGDVSSRGRTEISYTTLADRTPARRVYTPGTCDYPLTCPISGVSVVAEHSVTSDLGTGTEPTWDSYQHTYKAARADLHGRGWLGFAEHTVRRVETGATTVTEFDNAIPDPETKTYPYAHLPETTTYTVTDGTGREFQSITTNDYEIRRFESGTYTVEQPLATTSEEERPVGAAEWEPLRRTTTETTYDDFGNPDVVKSETVNGRTLTQDFDYSNDTAAWLVGLPTRTLSTGCTSVGVCRTRESTFDYDDKGNPTVTVVEPNRPALKLTTTTGYGPFGVVTSVTRTDNAGHSRTDTFEYNNADQLYPTDMVNAAGHRTLIDTHSGLGVPLCTMDPNGVKTTFRYDRFGRLRETNRSDGSYEHITHSNLVFGGRQLTTTTVAGGGLTAVLVDQLGRTRERRVTAFDGSIATTYTDYDPFGRGVRRTSRPALPGEAPQYTVTLYDNRGRVTSVTAPDGAQVRHEYLNRETHTYDAKGGHSYTIDTVDGDVDSRYEDDPNSTNWLITDFGHGPFGETTRIVAPDKTSQTMHYDRLGRLVRQKVPSSGVTITTYNAFGEVASITDAEKRVTTFDEYDQLGRVKKKTSPDGIATNTWDTALHGIGKLAEARSSDGVTIGYTYDELARDATTTWTVEGTRYEFGYSYDDIGRRVCITYPMIPEAAGPGATDRLTVGHVYNQHGYLAQVTDGCQVGGEVYWAAEARNGASQLESERLGNDVVTTRTYRPATGLLDNIQTTGPGTVGQLAEIGYDYDANRNVTQRSDLNNQRFETYSYDVLNRLDSWSTQTDPGQPGTTTTYTYNPIGNLKTDTVQRPNQPEQTTVYRYGEHGARAHWLTSRNDQQYGYDRTGQQTSGPNRTVQYNTSGLPTVLDWTSGQGQAQHTEFAYDPNGARVLKRDEDQTTVTVGGLFERRTPAGTDGNETHNLHNIFADGRVVAQINRIQTASGGMNPLSNVTYLHNDLQGSTVALTNHNGEPTGDDDPSLPEMFYDPFGRRIDAHNDPLDDNRRGGPRHGYTGHEHDDEYGLINMTGRIYDPETRRFLTPDTIQAPVSSQTHNRYSYVLNNPATLTDPTGFVSEPPTGGGPFSGGTGPFDPRGGTDIGRPSWADSWERAKRICRADSTGDRDADLACAALLSGRLENPFLTGSLNATPTSTDAEPSPSSDDDTSSAADDDSASVVDPENCQWCHLQRPETIYIQGVFPDEDPIPADEVFADVDKFTAQIESERLDAYIEEEKRSQERFEFIFGLALLGLATAGAGGALISAFGLSARAALILGGGGAARAGAILLPKVNKAFRFPGAGRSGAGVKNFVGPPNIIARGASPGRVFVTDGRGRVILDITKDRVKPMVPGQGFIAGDGRKLTPTPEQLSWIAELWGGR